MICLGTLYQQLSSNESGPPISSRPASDVKPLSRIYREKVAQCLVLSKYTKPVSLTVQTLILYFLIEVPRSEDTQMGTWIILGIIVRLALRMGYHRDASHFPQVSPFQGEMRRRSWAIVRHLDLVVSAQIGLPRMIRESQLDTAEPRNLLDEDLDENLVELPLPRPDTVQTCVQYFVLKNRLVSVYGRISDLTTSPQPPSYAEVMALDKTLHDTYNVLPQWLHMRPMTKSIMDGPSIIMRRIHVALIFQKAKCVLHRQYMVPARSDSRYSYSRTTCIEGALKILECQRILDQETQVGGRLYQDRWKASSVVKHDFLLAITVLCLDFDHDIKGVSTLQFQTETSNFATTQHTIQALQDSYPMWLRSSDSSQEARKAAKALRIVLNKARSLSWRKPADLQDHVAGASADGRDFPFFSPGKPPDFPMIFILIFGCNKRT